MTDPIEDRNLLTLQNWSKAAGLTTMLVGCVVLLGWILDISVLKSIVPGMISVKADTALSFIAVGLAVFFLRTKVTDPRLVLLRRASTVLITVVGLLTLSEYLFGWKLGMDELLFRDVSDVGGLYPGRMSPITSFIFLLIGSALLLIDIISRYRTAQFLTLTAFFFSLLALIGYLYGVESFYRFSTYVSIALPTAITFLILCVGILFAKPDKGWMAMLTSKSTAGRLARRLLPAAIVAPIFLGYLRMLGQKAGFYDTYFGLALFAISNIVVFTLLIAGSAASLHNSDSARLQAEEKFRQLNTDLEGRVLERTDQLTIANQHLEHDVIASEQAEAKFRALLEAAPDAIVIIDQQGLISLVNSQMEHLFGYSRAALLGKSVDMLIPERFRGKHSWHRADYFKSPRVRAMGIGLELFGLYKNGVEFPVEISLSPVDTAEGLLVAAAIRDTSSRKKGEAALRQSEERFAKAFHSSPAVLAITRLTDGYFIDVNDSYLKVFGYSRGEVIGHTASELRIYTNPTDRVEIVRRLQEQETVNNLEIVLRTKSDEHRNMLMSADVMDLDGREHILTTMVDITDRKQAEAALAQEHDQMQALMDNIPDTIYFKDTASRFTRINQAQARVLGLSSAEQAIGKTDADFQALLVSPGLYEEEQGMLKSGQPIIDRQQFIPTSSGQARWFSTTKVPMHDQRGQVNGLFGVSRDITERINSEEAVKQANARLTERVGQMSLLKELQDLLQACIAIEEVYQVTAQSMHRLFPAEMGALYVINNSRNWVETAAAWGDLPLQAQTFMLEDCWALRRGQPYLSGGENSNIPCRHLSDALPSFSLCMPLQAQGETVGILHLRSAPGNGIGSFNDVHQQLASLVADSVALALANVKLRESLLQQSIRDPLTELFNRRYMEETLQRELKREARSQKSVGIIMLDIDHFKLVNDTYGHDAGDEVLRQLGHFLKDHTRGGDIACRFGGEEFILVLPEANLEQTQMRAEQHLKDIRALPIIHNGRLIESLTLSFGVAVYPEHGSTSEAVLRAADAALYRAKREGRDRVVVAG